LVAQSGGQAVGGLLTTPACICVKDDIDGAVAIGQLGELMAVKLDPHTASDIAETRLP
jgi:hypothetical protein